MCGFAGLIDPARDKPDAELSTVAARMADRLRHRGPDAGGTWADAEAGVGIGHRRLAIIDLSSEGHQPMVSASGRYVIAYNGEVYNFPDLRAELEGQGHTFRGHSDTEVVLAAIEQWGIEAAVPRFIGMFAFALWDRETRRLVLARDRLGIKPLYYGRLGGVLLFGSELGALQAYPGFAAEVDRNALALYMLRNCVPAPYAIFRGVHKLAPATILTFDSAKPNAEPRSMTYWSLRDVVEDGVAHAPSNGADAADALHELLLDAVKKRLIADVPLGVFLSGGIDSSLVTALMQRVAEGPIRTFSVGVHNEAYNEAKDAAAVARHLGTQHTELYVSPDDALNVIPRLPDLFDEPFSDSSQVPTFLISQMARQHVTVCLSGDGGDKVFGGYNRYLWCPAIARRTGWLPRSFRTGLARLITSLPPTRWDALSAGLTPVLPPSFRQRNTGDKLYKMADVLAADDVAGMYRTLVGHWHDPESVLKGGREPANLLTTPSAWAAVPDFVEQMMYLDAMTYLPDDILTKIDRASMGVSLEARVPYLDHRVVEAAWTLPLTMKVAAGRGKRILRELLERYVPRSLTERPKMGFAVPLHDWLRGPLREWAEELLDERRLREEGFFNPEPVREQWQQHLSGARNWPHHLWDVLMFQAWLAAQRGP